MADEETKDEAAPEEEEATSGGGKKKIILLAVGAIALVAAAVGITVMVIGGGGEEEAVEEVVEEELEEPIYVALDPTFVVNYKDADARTRFLKADLNLMTYESEVEETISKHMPLIRGKLVSLFNQQIFEELIHQEGKDAFRAAALVEVQSVLETHLGKPGVEQVYFTTFVMQ